MPIVQPHLRLPISVFSFSALGIAIPKTPACSNKAYPFFSSDRKERKSYAVFVNFGDPTPPTAHPGALQAVTNLGTHTRKLAHDVEKV